MKVIILAAGKGERLYPLTQKIPKSLLELGKGITVLETQVKNIKICGVSEVIIVGGYKVEQIEAKIKNYREDIHIKIVYNPFYDISDNLVSAWMARYEMHGDFVLMNGDDVFHPHVLEGLLKNDTEICMVIDKKEGYEEDDMKVVTKGDGVYKVSKEIPAEEANGESIGMMKFQGGGKKKFVTTLEKMVRKKENLNKFYLAALQQIMNDGFPVHYFECSMGEWGEIDFHPDLKHIQKNIDKYFNVVKGWND